MGGVLALLLLAVVIFVCTRSRKGPAPSEKPHAPRSQSAGGGGGSGSGSRPLYGHIISAPIASPNSSYRTDFIRKSRSSRSSRSTILPRSLAGRFSRHPPRVEQTPPNPRISIPNPFDSPNLSGQSPARSAFSITSYDDRHARTGHVGAKLAPIRALKSSSSCSRRVSTRHVDADREQPPPPPRSQRINVFADPRTVAGRPSAPTTTTADNRATSFTDMMDEADMGDVHRGAAYVPGCTNTHVPGTTPRI